MIVCKTDVCLRIVNSSRTQTLPAGDARLAWENLVVNLEPTAKANLIQMKKDVIENK
jgi:hypothetical protein